MEPVKASINGHEYEITLFASSLALEWQDRLLRLGLEPIAIAMVDAGGMASVNQNALHPLSPQEMPFATAIRSLLAHMGPTKAGELGKELIAGHVVVQTPDGPELLIHQGKKSSDLFETHFQARTWAFWEIVAKVVEVNFRDFIDGVLSDVLGRVQNLALMRLVSAAEKHAKAGDQKAMFEAIEQVGEVLAGMMPKGSQAPGTPTSPSTAPAG